LQDGVNGYLVPWMDREHFGRRVEELLGDKHLARDLGERGRQFVLKECDFSRYINGLESLFARVSRRGIPATTV